MVSSNSASITASASLISSNSATISDHTLEIAANASGISSNAAGIALNSDLISANSFGIAANRQAIDINAAGIAANTAGIQNVREGSTAIASIPDLYLGTNETWSVAGGFSAYNDGFGGTEVGFGGGVQFRAKKTNKWSVGLAGARSGRATVGRVQLRIGG